MPRDPLPPENVFQDLSWRTRELGLELRRKLFEKVLPQSGPRATPSDGPDHKSAEPKLSDPKHADSPKTRRHKEK